MMTIVHVDVLSMHLISIRCAKWVIQ